jgi:hypothetical protein
MTWAFRGGQAGGKSGITGLGSSHTAPFRAAVPARPPTRTWHNTRAAGVTQWSAGARVQSTGVVVQTGHRGRVPICTILLTCLAISEMGSSPKAGCSREQSIVLGASGRPCSPLSSSAKQPGNIPAKVGREAQQEHEPPQHEHAPHPGFVPRDAELHGQQRRARGEQNVQGRQFGDRSEC